MAIFDLFFFTLFYTFFPSYPLENTVALGPADHLARGVLKFRERIKEFVTWTQAGFIQGRSCANNLWIICRVAERAIEFNVPVYCALVDYKGAFDALNHTTLGPVLRLFLSPKMVQHVLCLYFDAKALVTVNNDNGPEFDLQRGVRQGCLASPSFFTVA